MPFHLNRHRFELQTTIITPSCRTHHIKCSRYARFDRMLYPKPPLSHVHPCHQHTLPHPMWSETSPCASLAGIGTSHPSSHFMQEFGIEPYAYSFYFQRPRQRRHLILENGGHLMHPKMGVPMWTPRGLPPHPLTQL